MIAMPLNLEPAISSLTPDQRFEKFWELYRKYCPRVEKKQVCKKKFKQYSLDMQRVIYKDLQDRIKHYPDWQALCPKTGKRQFMRIPDRYLTHKMWEVPVDVKAAQRGPRDTTNETVRPSQEIAGLKKLRAQYEKSGLDTTNIDKQIEELENGKDKRTTSQRAKNPER